MKSQNIKKVASLILMFSVILAELNICHESVDARTVKQIEEDQKALQNQISELDSELYSIVAEIQEKEDQIAEIELEIEDTKEMLESAKEAASDQYDSMKIRIRYIYENGDNDFTSAIFNSGSISDMLNRMEYTTKVHSYDEDKMDMLENTVAEITELEAALEDEMTSLEAAKEDCEKKKDSLNALLVKKKKDLKSLDSELEKAKEAARQAAILAAQKKAAEEKARLEAQKKAMEEALKQQQASTVTDTTTTSGTTGTTTGGTSGSASGTTGGTSGDSNGGTTGGSTSQTESMSTQGLAVVAYASQFVGNPYVWGGTSLTNGCDCSGFVYAVYAHFGINFGERITSASARTVGYAVSYEDMQPGDIVCYAGHVGIYTGYGTIVEAQNPRNGITNTRSVNCHPILAIRRVL